MSGKHPMTWEALVTGPCSGGFTAVGITITQHTTRAGQSRALQQRSARPVVSPRGAQSFEYAPLWVLRAVRPSEVDQGGGAVVSVLGAHLHTAGACRFNPAPVGHTSVHIVSSAVVRCEVPLREPGDGAVTLVAETPAATAFAAVAAAAAAAAEAGNAASATELLRSQAMAAELSGAVADSGVAGLALLAHRPAVVTYVTAARAMASTTITIWGRDFLHSTSVPGGGGIAGAGAGTDEQASAAPPPHNAGGQGYPHTRPFLCSTELVSQNGSG